MCLYAISRCVYCNHVLSTITNKCANTLNRECLFSNDSVLFGLGNNGTSIWECWSWRPNKYSGSIRKGHVLAHNVFRAKFYFLCTDNVTRLVPVLLNKGFEEETNLDVEGFKCTKRCSASRSPGWKQQLGGIRTTRRSNPKEDTVILVQ